MPPVKYNGYKTWAMAMAMHVAASNDAILLAAINQFNAEVPMTYTTGKITGPS